MEYISKAQAIKLACEAADDWDGGENKSRDAYIIDAIEGAPAANVRPVVRGENIGTVAECDQFICSKCGIHLENWVRVEIDEDDGDVTHHEYVFNVCPNCGADMRTIGQRLSDISAEEDLFPELSAEEKAENKRLANDFKEAEGSDGNG